jgi:uncharacterized protein (TIGR02246 family)
MLAALGFQTEGDLQMTNGSGEGAARDLYERLLNAWNAHDAESFGALFSEDGLTIGFDGSQMRGPEIAKELGGIFADHETAPYIAKVRDVRAVGSDCALLNAIVGMVPPGADALNPKTNALQSLVAEKDGEEWRIVLFQNTPAQYHGRPELAEAHTAEIEEVRAAGATIA